MSGYCVLARQCTHNYFKKDLCMKLAWPACDWPPSQVLTYISPSSWFAHISMALLKLAGGALLQL